MLLPVRVLYLRSEAEVGTSAWASAEKKKNVVACRKVSRGPLHTRHRKSNHKRPFQFTRV